MNRKVYKNIVIALVLLFLNGYAFSCRIYIANVKGAINPVSKQYIDRTLKTAEQNEAECFILELDTPGGLMSSMQDITQRFLNAKVPVVVYVSPYGARAASAGAFIGLSAHILAMAPGTRLGAAHPVTLGIGTSENQQDTTMIRKVTNDAVAQIRSICDIRGRNQDLAEEMVRDSRSVEAKEAVELDAADIIADNLDTLIKLIDGWKVQLKSGAYMLETKDCEKIRINMNASEMILYTILEPNIAYILMIIGIMGLLMELSHPGAIFPGVIGGISLLMAFYAFQILPINYAGVLLILFGVILLILEIMITSYGILTIGGIASMLIGSFMLMSGAAPSLRISASVILPALLFLAAFFIFVITKAILAQGKKVTTGEKGLIGELGVASSNIDNEGFVLVHGEIWKARASMPISKGTRVRVVGVDGMVVIVEPSLGDGKEEN